MASFTIGRCIILNVTGTLRCLCIGRLYSIFITLSLTVVPLISFAQDSTSEDSTVAEFASLGELKKLSVEQLLDIEVTSVSRRTEKLSGTASAIQVITREDIHRFGATRLPEALRLATNLQVAQIDASQWAISSRGFNSSTGNKLLVMIDGRTVYSPLFAGMFWDIQDVLLEDVERIEVISGPGGTLWGVNAVNGVINIITREAKETHGFLAEASAGTELNGMGSLRYGIDISPEVNFRIYGKYTDRDGTISPDEIGQKNDWNLGQGGFRLDWDVSEASLFTLQGDLYQSETLVPPDPENITMTKGGNILGRWSHVISERSDFNIQMYFDRVHRSTTGSFDDQLVTYDIDYQHRYKIGARNDVVWGGGYRLAKDNFQPGTVSFVPARMSLETFSVFIQDEISLKSDKLSLIIGSKLQHNNYTGMELQPNIRLAFKFKTLQQALWTAVSRAVRMPSRVDRDFVVPPLFMGGPNFRSETLLAYELGYRIRPHNSISFSLALYYNDYNKIRSVEQLDPPNPFPAEISNGLEARSSGVELTCDYQATDWWRLRVGYTGMDIEFQTKPWSTDVSNGSSESAHSNTNILLRSSIDISKKLRFYQLFRYVSEIHAPMDVPAYSELDLRIAWWPLPKLELSFTGQNLLHKQHAEFGRITSRKEIERNLYIKAQWRF